MRKKLFKVVLATAILVLLAGAVAGCGDGGQEQENQGGNGNELSGTLQVNGSTTVAPVAQAWAEKFMEKHPGVEVIVTGTGSGDGIAALINGTTDIAMASRKMKDEEKEKFPEPPKEIVAGLDALAVIVNPANPVDSLAMNQIKDIFTGKVTNWKDVGGPDAEILVYTRDTSSGTYGFFKEFVLNDEEYTANTRRTASNAAMAKSVAQDEHAIGYCGIGFVNEEVKALGVSKGGGDPVAPSLETAVAGDYPIVRDLNMYTPGEPEGLAKAYLDFGLSAEGQELLKQQGYIPLQ